MESGTATMTPTAQGPDENASDEADGHDFAGSITGLFAPLKHGDQAALDEVWRRFFPRIAGLARKTLSGLPRFGLDADDVAQCAFISFWRALDGDREVEFEGREDLWNLLGLITVRKARKLARHQLAKKRGGGKTQTESDLAGQTQDGTRTTVRLDEILSEVTPPDFDLICEALLQRLHDEERGIVVLRLQGYSSQEIAARIGCSARSVQRKLEAVRGRWERKSADDD